MSNGHGPVTVRHRYSQAERAFLIKLIFKYKLHIYKGNVKARTEKWEQLAAEFNSIDTNIEKSVLSIKKCWDNIKTRHKRELRFIVKKLGLDYKAEPRSSITKALLTEDNQVQDDDELDSNNIKSFANNMGVDDKSNQNGAAEYDPLLETQVLEIQDVDELEPNDIPINFKYENNPETYSPAPSHSDLGSNVTEEINLSTSDEENDQESPTIRRYKVDKKQQEREKEMHKLKIAEQKLHLKTAANIYRKSKLECEIAQEILKMQKMKTQEARVRLNQVKKEKPKESKNGDSKNVQRRFVVLKSQESSLI